METPPLRVGMCPFANGNATIAGGEHALLRMETPLRGRSGGHTGAAPTISRMAPCPKVAGEVLADGQKRKKVAGEVLADGQKQEKVAGEVLADGLKREKVAGEVLADGLK